MENKEKNKKWWNVRKMSKREYGQTALVGLLGGYLIGGVIGDVVTLAGLVSAIVWIIQTIKQKLSKKKDL